ncbi:MAG: 3-methyl-2-oxobutanoate hydroxymethyltransferase [Candidatus Dadabacteria bacterium]|nr:MAG: 3-methyl-2-oxobutanoate hydroxymethyltransferase [Candidatus Dadabacteria bacterium]
MAKITIPEIRERKRRGPPLVMITAYDYPTARIVDQAGVDLILVGDSLGMVCLGYPDTVPVTLDEMIHHTAAVARGAERALVVGDLPFLTYQVSREQAIESAGRLVKEARADCVKLEGGRSQADKIEAIVTAGIPVMAHIGLTPQTATQLGGFKVQGRDPEAARALLEDAKAVEAAGAFAVVLECVPTKLATRISQSLSIPTIGIGAGPRCDGQVLVLHDLVGLFDRFVPKFVKRYADLGAEMRRAVETYCAEVRDGAFPGPEHGFGDG